MKLFYLVTAPQTTGFLRGNLAYMKARGFDVIVCSAPGQQIRETAKIDHVEYYEIPMSREISPLQDIVSLWRIFRLMRRLKPTIVNAGTPKAALLGMLTAKFSCVPVRIFQQRGLRVETTKGIKRIILWWTEKITCLCASKIICNSQSILYRMIELKPAPAKKLTTLCLGSSRGVNINDYNINSENLLHSKQLQNSYNFYPNTFILGFIGRIVKDKGITELIEAFKKILKAFPDSRLVIVGEEEVGDSIDKNDMDWLKQSPNVILTGHCKNVIPIYNIFDVLVFPSYREGFPNVVMEAAAMGIPTVGFNATGVIDAVVDGETGTIIPMKDSGSLAEAVLKYLNDSELRIRHGINGRKRVVRYFQPPMLWEAYYQEYCELLKQKKIPIPKPDKQPEPLPLLDPEEDEKEFRKWYAVREIALKKQNKEKICRMLNLNIDEIENMIAKNL
ncbi:MAG: glycosyltransferase family 4 protein [Planctomycetaceae bacterium]|jgi:glycosyltransferase involved in cell wall biosynthesis|nr:glycosyltransferase family 4 protein [Planctomycetaceae bacterium]